MSAIALAGPAPLERVLGTLEQPMTSTNQARVHLCLLAETHPRETRVALTRTVTVDRRAQRSNTSTG